MEAKITNALVQLRYAACVAGVAFVGLLLLTILVGELDNRGVPSLILLYTVAIFIASFMIFHTWAVLRHCPHEGWRRAFIVVGAVGGIVGLVVGYDMNYYGELYLQTAFEIALCGVGGFVATVFGINLVKWVREGFKR